MYRSHKLDELNLKNINQTVTLSGWVSKIRNLGAFIFIDLRDRYGITQILIKDEKLKEKTKDIKSEYVIQVTGTVIERASKNPNMKTGDIEVEASNIEILSESLILPFEINSENEVSEGLRLKYRYLDLRKNKMKENMIARSKMLNSIRKFMDKEEFLEVDTPILGKSTPEGARDFLVPSRLYHGSFYALPQSPQLFKQTLMVSGLDKYYQIAKCFRDEDLRKDRQLEFTQLDIEMSFVHQKDVMDLAERLAKYVMKEVKGIEIENEFPIISYDEAINKYGSDKPDTRFDIYINDISDIASKMEFNVFKSAESVRAIVAPSSDFSRKKIKELEDYLKTYFKVSGLAYIKVDDTISSSISKFLTEDIQNELKERLNYEKNNTVFIVADTKEKVLQSLGALRIKLAEDLNLIDDSKFNYLWVVDFPMFEWSEEEKRYKAQHHPFTSVKKEDIQKLIDNDLESIKTNSYDMVLNGYEIGGGSIRIHDSLVQDLVFDRLNISNEEKKVKFGFFLETLKYGVPPHGGLAFGFDRWLMALLNEKSIKEVIAFPKTNKGQDLLTEAPSGVDYNQIEELGIKIK